MRMILIRHGHVDRESPEGPRMVGCTDLPLTPRGRSEARAARDQLRGFDVAGVYSSSLRRARETAEIAAAGAGVRTLRSLREIDCGRVDGWPLRRVRKELPAVWQANEAQDDDEFAWPGGESYRQFRRRVVRAANVLASMHSGEQVVVVTHAGVISTLLGVLHGRRAAEWEPFRPDTGSLTFVEWRGGQGRVIAFSVAAAAEDQGAVISL
jgi:broad specificity phosphatase PhoE